MPSVLPIEMMTPVPNKEEELIEEIKILVTEKPIQSIKNEVEEIREAFNSKFTQELETNKEQFLAEGGNIIDYHYTTPTKKEFNSVYFNYKEKRNHYRSCWKGLSELQHLLPWQ